MFSLPLCVDCKKYDPDLKKHSSDQQLRCPKHFEDRTAAVKKADLISASLGYGKIPGLGEVGKPVWIQDGSGWAYIHALIKDENVTAAFGHSFIAAAHQYRHAHPRFAYAEALAKLSGALHKICKKHQSTEYLHEREVAADKAREAYREFVTHLKKGP